MKDQSLLSIEKRLARILRQGVLTAGALMLIGWLWSSNWNSESLTSLSEYNPHPRLPAQLSKAWTEQNWGLLIAYSGLSLLVSLPVLRVLVTGLLFAQQKEKILSAAAFFVLLLLLISFTLGVRA